MLSCFHGIIYGNCRISLFSRLISSEVIILYVEIKVIYIHVYNIFVLNYICRFFLISLPCVCRVHHSLLVVLLPSLILSLGNFVALSVF